MFAGLSDTTTNRMIRSLDAKSLRDRDQILLVDSGECTRVRVLRRVGADFEEVWHFAGVPDPVWGFREQPKGRESCAAVKGGMNVNAHGTPDGRVVVEVRANPDGLQRTVPTDTYTFAWNGSQYQPEGGSH